MKEITIKVPDNCELKQDGNTYTIVEKEKKLTYKDITRKLFSDNDAYYINNIGEIQKSSCYPSNVNNCTSKKQAEKLLAINKLMNVAKYLNGNWQPDWYNGSVKYYISNRYNEFEIAGCCSTKEDFIYFKSKELAQQAIEILGEEIIKLALCTDY